MVINIMLTLCEGRNDSSYQRVAGRTSDFKGRQEQKTKSQETKGQLHQQEQKSTIIPKKVE